MQKKMQGYLLLGTLIFVIDRLSKMAALAWCTDYVQTALPFLSFELVFNRGVAWSFFHSAETIPFVIVSLLQVSIAVVLCWWAYEHYRSGYLVLGETCIIAGSLSNIVDRLVYHGVIDFIILSYRHYSWPVFNIADAAIVIGVGIVIFQHRE